MTDPKLTIDDIRTVMERERNRVCVPCQCVDVNIFPVPPLDDGRRGYCCIMCGRWWDAEIVEEAAAIKRGIR